MSNKKLYKSSVNRMLCGDHHADGRSRNPGVYHCGDHYPGLKMTVPIKDGHIFQNA